MFNLIGKSLKVGLLPGVLLFLGTNVPVLATTLDANFNSLAVLNAGSGPAAIAAYLSGQLGCVACVTVTGATTNQKYNGEGHVVGPGGKSLTLGTSDGATSSNSPLSPGSPTPYDTFISNVDEVGNANTHIADTIDIKITDSNFALSGMFAFDYEIFASNVTTPDLIFTAKDKNGNTVANWQQFGVTPGTTNGSITSSPLSSNEASKQWIGHWNSPAALNNVTELIFADWPETVAFDNLKVTNNVPEPASMVLLGSTLLISFNLMRRRLRKQKA